MHNVINYTYMAMLNKLSANRWNNNEFQEFENLKRVCFSNIQSEHIKTGFSKIVVLDDFIHMLNCAIKPAFAGQSHEFARYFI